MRYSVACTPAGRAGLDLPGGKAHGQIGNEGVLSLAGAVAGHDAPACRLGVTHLQRKGAGQARCCLDLAQCSLNSSKHFRRPLRQTPPPS